MSEEGVITPESTTPAELENRDPASEDVAYAQTVFPVPLLKSGGKIRRVNKPAHVMGIGRL